MAEDRVRKEQVEANRLRDRLCKPPAPRPDTYGAQRDSGFFRVLEGRERLSRSTECFEIRCEGNTWELSYA
ncbi:hypothetical protein Tcan_11486 [Toxocara canis]|uniref:Uncharacterized protein n=1 Tax=Toxocara canis TaxID=6265 RepID=A0A0B2V6F4_TOXCA|nr:hypothetical protein Tcan_11486 [Toxocara canis]